MTAFCICIGFRWIVWKRKSKDHFSRSHKLCIIVVSRSRVSSDRRGRSLFSQRLGSRRWCKHHFGLAVTQRGSEMIINQIHQQNDLKCYILKWWHMMAPNFTSTHRLTLASKTTGALSTVRSSSTVSSRDGSFSAPLNARTNTKAMDWHSMAQPSLSQHETDANYANCSCSEDSVEIWWNMWNMWNEAIETSACPNSKTDRPGLKKHAALHDGDRNWDISKTGHCHRRVGHLCSRGSRNMVWNI